MHRSEGLTVLGESRGSPRGVAGRILDMRGEATTEILDFVQNDELGNRVKLREGKVFEWCDGCGEVARLFDFALRSGWYFGGW